MPTHPARPSTSPGRADDRLHLALFDQSPVHAAGVRALLATVPDAPTPVDLRAALPSSRPGVVLYDAGAPRQESHEVLQQARDRDWLLMGHAWPEEARRLVHQPGAPRPDGWVSKGADGPRLLGALRHLRRRPGARLSGPAAEGDHHGLSPREHQMLVLIAAGLSNAEIAATCYLSVNSVKSFIRTAYRKIDVQRRVQAVAWVHDHGLDLADADPQPAA